MATHQERTITRTEFARRLTEAGMRNFLVVDVETARSLLTERRMELLETVRDKSVESVTHLAEILGRDKAAVSRDLDLLFERDLIEYERNGSRKIPVLKHETVLVEPIL